MSLPNMNSQDMLQFLDRLRQYFMYCAQQADATTKHLTQLRLSPEVWQIYSTLYTSIAKDISSRYITSPGRELIYTFHCLRIVSPLGQQVTRSIEPLQDIAYTEEEQLRDTITKLLIYMRNCQSEAKNTAAYIRHVGGAYEIYEMFTEIMREAFLDSLSRYINFRQISTATLHCVRKAGPFTVSQSRRRFADRSERVTEPLSRGREGSAITDRTQHSPGRTIQDEEDDDDIITDEESDTITDEDDITIKEE